MQYLKKKKHIQSPSHPLQMSASISAEAFCLVGVPGILQATLVVFTEMDVGINDIVQQNLHGCKMTSQVQVLSVSGLFVLCYADLFDYKDRIWYVLICIDMYIYSRVIYNITMYGSCDYIQDWSRINALWSAWWPLPDGTFPVDLMQQLPAKLSQMATGKTVAPPGESVACNERTINDLLFP